MRASDDEVKQALGQVAKLGGFNIKRMVATDDLKDHTITITITRTSDGWHQERLAFDDVGATVEREHSELNDLAPMPEPEPGLLVTAEADGHVVDVKADGAPEPETVPEPVPEPVEANRR